jgi:cytochrome c-type biogenesis protein CcmF
LFIPLLLAMPFGPLLAWKRGDLLGAAQRLMAAIGIALAGIVVVFVAEGGHPSLAPFGIGLAAYVMVGAVSDLVERTGLFRLPVGSVMRRAAGLPRSIWGTAFAHFGMGLVALGIVSVSHWGSERIVSLKPSETVAIKHYQLRFDGLIPRQGPNYREQIAHFTVRKGGVDIGVMEPAKRSFASRQTTTTEAALLTRGASQLYLSLGDSNDDGSVAVRLYYKPLVLLIWFGAVVMAFGGALSLSDRRLRVGAPKPARKTAKVAAMSPAE